MKKILSFSAAALLLLVTVFSSCKKENVTVTQPGEEVSNPINSDTIGGTVKGTMLAGKTYYIKSDITVNIGDTLFVQSGVTVHVLNNSTFYISGIIISEGTQDAPNTFTGPAGVNEAGSWGGFQCDTASYVSFKWTHINYTGGPDQTGSPRKTLVLQTNSPFIFQD